MTQRELIKCIKNKEPKFNFDFDELGMTWQISYVRFVGGDKKQFNSIEYFYFSLIKSINNVTSNIFGSLEWKYKVDLLNWAANLEIEQIETKDFDIDLYEAFKELSENENKWEESERIDKSKIKIPNGLLNCWTIKETKELRHPVGLTWSKIVETAESFFYLERHWES
jgi:hypothetical protein